MTSAQFEDRVNGLSERPCGGDDTDAGRVTFLHDQRLRLLLHTTAGLSDESQELLVAVADRLRITERRGRGATAELY